MESSGTKAETFVLSFALCASAQQGGVSPGRPRYRLLGCEAGTRTGEGRRVEVMPRHVYGSVWDEATCGFEKKGLLRISLCDRGDKQFLWSSAGASLAAPPLKQDGGSGVPFVFACFKTPPHT